MDDRRKLFLDALSEPGPDIALTSSELQDRWESVLAEAQARLAFETLDEARRTRWRSGVKAALDVVVGATQGTSRILEQMASSLLPLPADAWRFQPTPVLRGSRQPPVARMAGDNLNGMIVIDDRSGAKQVVAELTGIAPDAEVPMLLVLSVLEDGTAFATEVTGDVVAEAADGARTLRYKAALGDGRHRFYWGYPQAS